MRDYVLKVAEDKKWELRFLLRDKLREELLGCEPTEEAIKDVADDLYNVAYIWGNTFAKIDELVAEYVRNVAGKGDDRELALETVKRILEL